MAEVVQLKKPTPRPTAKRLVKKKNILKVRIDADIDRIPENCQEINIACNLFSHWTGIRIYTLAAATGPKGLCERYKKMVNQTLEGDIKEILEQTRCKNLEEFLEGDGVGYLTKEFGSFEGWMEHQNLFLPTFCLHKITKRAIYILIKRMYPMFQDFKFEKDTTSHVIDLYQTEVADEPFKYIK
jgi:hypothetical protein